MTSPTPSLRERSKAKRRIAIQRAALRLFAERGYDGATIAEIAEEADVAVRTVSMYFPTKLEIALSPGGDIASRLTATFVEYPQLSFTDVVDRWLLGEAGAMDPDLAAMTSAMFEANPALRAVSSSQVADAARMGRGPFIAEVGLSPEDPMLQIVGAAVGAAISEYLTTGMKQGIGAGLHEPFVRYLRAIITSAKPT